MIFFKSRANTARIFELLFVNRVLAVCLMSGISVAAFSAHCSTLTLNPHGQIAAWRETEETDANYCCRWWEVFRHWPCSTHTHTNTHIKLCHWAGKPFWCETQRDLRGFWRREHKQIHLPSFTVIVSSSIKYKQACVSACKDTHTHTHTNPSQDHLANGVVRGTYEQAVSHMNISFWGWTGCLKHWCLQTFSLEMSDHVCEHIFR